MAYRLDPEQFKRLLMGLKTSYPADWFIPNEEAASIWYNCLMDLPGEALSLGISKWIMTSDTAPKVANIRAAAMEFMPHAETENEQEACAAVRRAVQNSAYGYQEEYEKLPEVIRKSVGSSETLRAWSHLDEVHFESVALSHFITTYRSVSRSYNDKRLVSPEIGEQMRMAITEKKEGRRAAIACSRKEKEADKVEMSEENRKKYEELRKRLISPDGWSEDRERENGKGDGNAAVTQR